MTQTVRYHMRLPATLAVALAAGALLLAGCDGDPEDASSTTPEPTAATPPAEAPDDAEGTAEPSEDHSGARPADDEGPHQDGPARAWITLGSPEEFSLVPETKTVPAGQVEFTVANEGTIEHEVIFIRTDRDSGDLPPDAAGGAAEDGAVTPIGSGHGDGGGDPAHVGAHFHAGEGGTVTVDLEPGRYALVCNLPGHYASGMHANLVVEPRAS